MTLRLTSFQFYIDKAEPAVSRFGHFADVWPLWDNDRFEVNCVEEEVVNEGAEVGSRGRVP